jgi:hypothetical protein
MTTPRAARGLALAGLLAAVSLATAQPPAGQDAGERATVTFRGPGGKIVTEGGETKSLPGRVELTSNKKTTTITGPDLLRVEPTTVANLGPELVAARAQETGGDTTKALADYAALAQAAGPNAPPATKRYLAFKEALLTTKLADAKTGEDFVAGAKKSIDAWDKVAPLSRGSWEIWPTLTTAARLHAELNDFGKAASSLAALAATPGLPKNLRGEALIGEAAMKLRAKDTAAVAAAIQPLEGDATLPKALKEKVAVLKAAAAVNFPMSPPAPPPTGEAAAKIQAAIDAATDPAARGLGYTALAELQLANGLPREAMWAYLWVDVVYNADHADHVLAVARLAQIFDVLGDKDRAEQFREKLTRIR